MTGFMSKPGNGDFSCEGDCVSGSPTVYTDIGQGSVTLSLLDVWSVYCVVLQVSVSPTAPRFPSLSAVPVSAAACTSDLGLLLSCGSMRHVGTAGGAGALLTAAVCTTPQQEDGTTATPPLTVARIGQLLTQVDLNVIASFAGIANARANFHLAQARLALRENNKARATQLAAKAQSEQDTPDADPWEQDRLQRLVKVLTGRKN